jgi:hypothetical protein
MVSLTHDEAILLCRLLGHHFVAHVEPGNPASLALNKLSGRLLDYAYERGDWRRKRPLYGLAVSPHMSVDEQPILRFRALTDDERRRLDAVPGPRGL